MNLKNIKPIAIYLGHDIEVSHLVNLYDLALKKKLVVYQMHIDYSNNVDWLYAMEAPKTGMKKSILSKRNLNLY